MQANPKLPKRQQVRRQYYFCYCYRKSIAQINRYRDVYNNNILQEIVPAAQGRLGSIWYKFQRVLGNIATIYKRDMQSKQEILTHPLFSFLLKKFVYYLCLHSQKTEKQLQSYLIEELSQQTQNQQIKEVIKNVIEDTVKYTSNNKIKIRNQELTGWFQKIQLYQKKVQKQEDFIIPQLKAYLRKIVQNQSSAQLETLMTSQSYMKFIIQNVSNIEVLEIKQQWQKIRLFIDTNRSFFNTSMIPQKIEHLGKSSSIKIFANRPSKEQVPLFSTLAQYVKLLPDQINYEEQIPQIIQAVFIQLKKYSQSINQKMLSFYQFVSPKNVVFDHLALAPKLLLEPLLLDALGLRNKPSSIQTFLVFSPCPRQFDFFKSPLELEPKIRMLLDDPFHIVKSFIQKVSKLDQSKQLIQKQRQQLILIKQKISVWRFLLTAYYLKNRKQLGKPLKIIGYEHSQNSFLLQCKKIENQLNKSISYLKQFLGNKGQSHTQKSFKFLMSQIANYYSKQKDSFLDIAKFAKTNRFLDLKRHFVKCIINLFGNQNYWNRVQDVKKCCLIFLLLANQILQMLQILVKMEKNRLHDGEQFNKKLYKQRMWIIQKKHLFLFLQNFYNEIKRIKEKNPQKENQSKFLNKDDIGIKLFENIKMIYEDISRLENLHQNYIFIQQSADLQKQNKSQDVELSAQKIGKDKLSNLDQKSVFFRQKQINSQQGSDVNSYSLDIAMKNERISSSSNLFQISRSHRLINIQQQSSQRQKQSKRDNLQIQSKIISQADNQIIRPETVLLNNEQQNSYRKMFEKYSQVIERNFDKNRQLIRQLLYLQLKNNRQKEVKQHKLLNQIVDKRTELIFYSYLTLNEQNFIYYQSLLIPLLKLSSSKPQDLFKVKVTREQLMVQKQWHALVQQYIKLQRYIPHQLKYLVKSAQRSQ